MPTDKASRLAIGLLLAGIGLAVAGVVAGLGAASVLELPLLPAVVAAVGLALISLHEPRWGLVLTLFTMPFEKLMALFPPKSIEHESFLSTLTVTKLMLVVVILMWLLRVLVLKDSTIIRKTFSTPSPIVALILVFYAALSFLNAAKFGGFLKGEVTLISDVALFLFVFYLMDDKRWALRLIVALVIPYIIVGLMGVYEVSTKKHILEMMGRPMPDEGWALYQKTFRPAGPSGDPDYFATSILYGLMLTLAMWRFVRSWLLSAVLLVVVGVFFFDIYATGSRGAMLGLVMAMAVFFFFLEMPYKVTVAVLAIAGAISGFALYSVFVSARSAGRFTGKETKSLQYRLGWQQQCFGMIEDHPMLGVGIGSFAKMEYRIFDPRPPRKAYNAANSYLQLAAEAGFLRPCSTSGSSVW